MEEVKYIPGDLVIFGNKIVKIVQVNEEECWFKGDGFKGYATTKEFNGIPITPAILKANGWRVFGKGNYTILYSKSMGFPDIKYIKENHSFDFLFHGNTMLINMQYCHQLQHLLFGLGLDSKLKV